MSLERVKSGAAIIEQRRPLKDSELLPTVLTFTHGQRVCLRSNVPKKIAHFKGKIGIWRSELGLYSQVLFARGQVVTFLTKNLAKAPVPPTHPVDELPPPPEKPTVVCTKCEGTGKKKLPKSMHLENDTCLSCQGKGRKVAARVN